MTSFLISYLQRLASLGIALGCCLPGTALAQPAEVDLDLLARLEQSVLEQQGFNDAFDAEVWYESMYPRLQRYDLSDSEKVQILQSVHAHSRANGLSPKLVLAVIDVESSFNRFAISRAGAQGLMQVMSFWKNELGRPEDNLTDPQINLKYGTTILSYYLERAEGDTTEALARYNGSYPKTWYAERVYRALNNWQH